MRDKSTELFIVDNTDEHWKALEYVSQWCDISETIDIATGWEFSNRFSQELSYGNNCGYYSDIATNLSR